jgi:hypothetical protein
MAAILMDTRRAVSDAKKELDLLENQQIRIGEKLLHVREELHDLFEWEVSSSQVAMSYVTPPG